VSRCTRPGLRACWRAPPAVTIVLALEARLGVVVDALDEQEYLRLRAWLGSSPTLLRLLDEAYALERRPA
jgi:hypothetical protein